MEIQNSLDLERKASILAEAFFAGDEQTAERWGITSRTIRNYRKELETNQEFSAFFQLKKGHLESEWKADGVRFLKKALSKLEQLIDKADSAEDIPKVAGAIKIVGELDVVKNALNSGPTGESATAAALSAKARA